MPVTSTKAVQLVIGGRTFDNVASVTGGLISVLTGRPEAGLLGKAIDLGTDGLGIDVVINTDDGTISTKPKIQKET